MQYATDCCFVPLADAWAEMRRGQDGKLRASANRFGAGIADLADYVHSKGGSALSCGSATLFCNIAVTCYMQECLAILGFLTQGSSWAYMEMPAI
jgi:Alpha galactosidase A